LQPALLWRSHWRSVATRDDADPDIHILKEAQAEYAKLQ
jgi:hypothetical protein